MIELSTQQIARFHEDGLIITDRLVDVDTASRLASRFEPVFRGEFDTGVLPDEVNWQEGKSAPELTRQICNGWKGDHTIASVVLREDIGRACATLGNWPGARVMQDNVLWKPPGARPLGYHQDNSYLQWFAPGELITCWIALDDTSAAGGTMELVRGSHRWGEFPPAVEFHGPEHYREEMNAAAATLDRTPDIVPVEVPRGGGSFHHGWTWHGSGFNHSGNPRRALVVHCMSSEARYVPEHLDKGIGPVYGRYFKRFGDNTMDENQFPIVWTKDNRRTSGLDAYISQQMPSEST